MHEFSLTPCIVHWHDIILGSSDDGGGNDTGPYDDNHVDARVHAVVTMMVMVMLMRTMVLTMMMMITMSMMKMPMLLMLLLLLLVLLILLVM